MKRTNGKKPRRPDEAPRRAATGTKTAWPPGNLVLPAPAALVSCQAPGDKPNMLTVAWCGNVSSAPAMLSISVRPSRHSFGIIEATGEFVVNIPSVAMKRAVDWCGVVSGRDKDKFAEAGLTPAASLKVACPAVAEAPINIECVVRNRLELGTHVMYVAEVLAVQVAESCMDGKGKFMLERADPLCFAHGAYYSLGDPQGGFGWSVRKRRR